MITIVLCNIGVRVKVAKYVYKYKYPQHFILIPLRPMEYRNKTEGGMDTPS